MNVRRNFVPATTAALLVIVASGCGGADDQQTTLKVIAATSLKSAVETIADEYESAHPGTTVQNTFAPSDQIQRQIEGGLKADVIAMASGDQMKPLVAAEFAEDAVPFTGNKLAIAVGNKSKAGIDSSRDLAKPSKLSLGQKEVPIGKYADAAIASMADRYGDDYAKKVADNVVNRAPNAADVITPVALGGADASISYVTDLKANATRVRAVEIPAWAQPTIAYWIAEGAKASDAAAELIDFIESPDGQAVLQKKGFLPVPAAVGSEP
jgi:molybdate transport system substrate-binding protein